ncbi:MAG TPA: ATP-binding protein, partial [Candidatus Competibacteraceae bacterium]|nr:ATP-binding protein [Candidatus Competibacteraceae bacterium]
RTIINAVPDVLLVLDEEGRYLEILTAQPHLLSTDRTALKGRLVSDVLPAEIAQAYLTAIRQTLLTRRYQRFEYALALEHAGPRYFEARTAPLEVPLTDKPAVVLLARDVTSQRLTEASLRQAQKMEAVGQLTGGMAHDFNNLLAVILGNLELLAEDLTDSALADLVHRAQGATERGAELIRRLLAFARKQPLQIKAMDLNRLVAGMWELLQRTLGETIQIETRLAADLVQIVIDPSQLETALLNLAVNARDAMPTGGRLTIETANCMLAEDDPRTQSYQMNPGLYVLLAVSDTGCGMPPAVVEHAVEPFFTTKEAGQGSGLGLSMVYGLVKQSGGHLQLYSEVGQGTTLRIYLPAVPLAPGPPRATSHPAASLPTGQGQLILVVEDEASVRRLAVHLLQSLGYQTVEAETAASALAVLAANPGVAVLFTDVVLPGGRSGLELAQEACQQRPGLKVLFTSGYTEAHLTQFTYPLAGSKLLSKPYRKAQLADQLHVLLCQDSSDDD